MTRKNIDAEALLHNGEHCITWRERAAIDLDTTTSFTSIVKVNTSSITFCSEVVVNERGREVDMREAGQKVNKRVSMLSDHKKDYFF